MSNQIRFSTNQTSSTMSHICFAVTQICLKANQIWCVANQMCDDTSYLSRPQCVRETSRKPDLICHKAELFFGKTDFANGVSDFGLRICGFVRSGTNWGYTAPDVSCGDPNLARLLSDLVGLKEEFRHHAGNHIHGKSNRVYAGHDFIRRGLNLFRAARVFFAATQIVFVAKEIGGDVPPICFDPNQNTKQQGENHV